MVPRRPAMATATTRRRRCLDALRVAFFQYVASVGRLFITFAGLTSLGSVDVLALQNGVSESELPPRGDVFRLSWRRLKTFAGLTSLGLPWVWRCRGFAMGLRWVCRGFAMRWPCVGHAFAMRLPCVSNCFAFAMHSPCVCHAFAMRLPCVRHAFGNAMRFPCVCHAVDSSADR